jgi:SAM-dependent methyltransferase
MEHALYWETTGATKTFTHPLRAEWLATVSRASRVLDYGCGYGRLTAELADHGFEQTLGTDISAALIDRGRRDRPDLRLEVIESPPTIRRPDGSFDLIVLFAVLTCVPGDDDQRELVAELHRLPAPGGLLYVSDLVRQSDERNRRRYDARGVFTTDDGAVCRHHEVGHLRALLRDFDLEAEQPIAVTSMNGNPVAGVQLLARRR